MENRKREAERLRKLRQKRLRQRRITVAIAAVALVLAIVFIQSVASKLGKTSGKNGGSTKQQVSETQESGGEQTPVISREELEKTRQQTYGDFYVPLPPEGDTKKVVESSKGLYVSSNVAAMDFSQDNIAQYEKYISGLREGASASVNAGDVEHVNKLERALAIANATEINALVIDVKTDWGTVIWKSDIAGVKQLGSEEPIREDNIKALLDYMTEKEIYKIARVVAFKDPYLPEKKPEHAIQLTSGGVYRDDSGTAWVNPFDEYIWNYVISISQEAALRGFDEIHYDYVRFPDNAAYYNEITDFPGRNDRTKAMGISQFLEKAKTELKDYNVDVGAAVFGTTTTTWNDVPEDIGQTWSMISQHVDAISAMIYPSHYSSGWYGFDIPDQNPYGVLLKAQQDALIKNAAIDGGAQLRPWIQAFTATWVYGYLDYTPEAIAQQIYASRDLGIEGYLVWNAQNNYDPRTYLLSESYTPTLVEKAGVDVAGRTAEEVLRLFLEGEQQQLYIRTYVSSARKTRTGTFDEYVVQKEETEEFLESYEILEVTGENDVYEAKVNVRYLSKDGVAEITPGIFKVYKEDHIYKIERPVLNFATPVESTSIESTPVAETNP